MGECALPGSQEREQELHLGFDERASISLLDPEKNSRAEKVIRYRAYSIRCSSTADRAPVAIKDDSHDIEPNSDSSKDKTEASLRRTT